MSEYACTHERVNEDDFCMSCGARIEVEAPAPAQPSAPAPQGYVRTSGKIAGISDHVKLYPIPGTDGDGWTSDLPQVTQPHCVGYPVCDGDLPGEPHEKECPAVQPTTVVHVPVPEGNESRYVEVLREQSQAAQPVASRDIVRIKAEALRANKAIFIAIEHYRCEYAASLEARLAIVTGERDRQYEFNAGQIAKLAEAEARAEAVEARNKELENKLEFVFSCAKHSQQIGACEVCAEIEQSLVDEFPDWMAVVKRADSLSLLLREVEDGLQEHEWDFSKDDEREFCGACGGYRDIGHNNECWKFALLTRLSSDTKEEK